MKFLVATLILVSFSEFVFGTQKGSKPSGLDRMPAREIEPEKMIEVDHFVHCEVGASIYEAAFMATHRLETLPYIYSAEISANGKHYVIKKPYKVSAPALSQSANDGKFQICVTLTK